MFRTRRLLGLSVLLGVYSAGCAAGPSGPSPTPPPTARDGVIDFTPVSQPPRRTVVLPGPPLRPEAMCDESTPDAVVSFEDEALERALRDRFGAIATTPLTCELVSGARLLNLLSLDIESLVGIQNLRGAEALTLSNNAVTDLAPLALLPALRSLRLNGNRSLSNIEPLLEHPSLEEVSLLGTAVSCDDVARLEARGIFVFSACE